MTRLGIVLSGRGSNFEAIAEQIGQDKLGAEIAVVVSNRADAPGLDAARRLGLSAVALPSRGVERPEYDRSLIAVLRAHNVEWVILAGYMRILTADFIRAFPERILNIHPSLLPAFPGLDAQHQAFAYGVKVTGCTVHFVDEHLDRAAGVAHHDVLDFGQSLNLETSKLADVASEVLSGTTKTDLEIGDMMDIMQGVDVKGWARIAVYNLRDAELPLRIMVAKEQVAFSVQVSAVSGCSLPEVCAGGQQKRLLSMVRREVRRRGLLFNEPSKLDFEGRPWLCGGGDCFLSDETKTEFLRGLRNSNSMPFAMTPAA